MNLSEFTPALRINGGGSPKKDCVSGWLLQNPGGYGIVDSKGNVPTKQECTQGDPTCDVDSDPLKCTFHVGLCFRLPNLPDCPLTSFTNDSLIVNDYVVTKPSEKDVLNPSKPQAGPEPHGTARRRGQRLDAASDGDRQLCDVRDPGAAEGRHEEGQGDAEDQEHRRARRQVGEGFRQALAHLQPVSA
jgi:hypothetical protein